MKVSKISLTAIISAFALAGCAQPAGTGEITYKLGFYQAEGDKLDQMDVTVGKTTYQDVLAFQSTIGINVRTGYDTVWEDFDFEALNHDYVVDAKYILHDYTISFVYEEEVKATTTYNVESETVKMPTFEDQGGYFFAPDEFEFKGKHEDFSVELHLEETTYVVSLMDGDTLLSTINYTISNPTVTLPDGGKGYTTKWVSDTLQAEAGETIDFTGHLGNYSFNRVATANQYTITYLQGSEVVDTQTVTFDSEYTLIDPTSPNPDYDGVCWAEDGKEFAKTGVWQIDHDVELTSVWGLSFEKETLPATLTGGNRVDFSICTDAATSGKQSLRVDINSHGSQVGDYTVNLAKSFLDDCFADPEVVAVNFDAKGSAQQSNFRSRHFEIDKVSNWTYENNYTPMGLDTNWKTFSFKREYMEGLENFIIGAYADGNTVWIDNIRPVKHHLDGDILGFENGITTTDSYGNRIFFDGGHANAAPTQKQVFLVNGEASKSVTYDYSIKSEGNRSIKVSKGNGFSSIYISTALRNYLGENGYIMVDVYSTVAAQSNPTVMSIGDGLTTDTSKTPHMGPLGDEGYIHPANTWVTYKLPTSRMTADGRFMQIMGSTAGDWYFDNVHLYPAA